MLNNKDLYERVKSAVEHCIIYAEGFTSADVPELIEDVISVYEPGMDGYQLAKHLDHKKSWDITPEMIGELDQIGATEAEELSFSVEPDMHLAIADLRSGQTLTLGDYT